LINSSTCVARARVSRSNHTQRLHRDDPPQQGVHYWVGVPRVSLRSQPDPAASPCTAGRGCGLCPMQNTFQIVQTKFQAFPILSACYYAHHPNGMRWTRVMECDGRVLGQHTTDRQISRGEFIHCHRFIATVGSRGRPSRHTAFEACL
jgi:hypothetical protein